MKKDHEFKLQILGWILFVGCACCYLLSSFKSNDWIGFVGGILFLTACIVFLIPLLVRRSLGGHQNKEHFR